jgi:hypothetical protein
VETLQTLLTEPSFMDIASGQSLRPGLHSISSLVIVRPTAYVNDCYQTGPDEKQSEQWPLNTGDQLSHHARERSLLIMSRSS